LDSIDWFKTFWNEFSKEAYPSLWN
jgi:hypothetical protein